MATERWQQLEDLFHAALDRAPADREAFVVDACRGDAGLRQEVDRLLHAHEQAGSFIAQAAADLERVAATVPPDGLQIGAYRIVGELGRGGMGSVYLGERADAQFQMRVAIKVIKRGMDTDAVLQRFRHERQILAGLDHPNIARLLDGGTTGDGVPYFVMEYVDGQPVDEYCRAHRLSIDDRLQLFRQVCAAVAYAHQNLVVHRDIKPSNILVTSERIPKLLDFGIAKLLDHDGADVTVATEFGRQAMTPQYASPEQLRGDRVTTVSDVYALGVLLYELLTDARPYELTGKSPDEIGQIVADTEVVRPSAMAARSDDHSTSRRLRGDLDTIVIAAMRKDPADRYASVALVAEDVRRHMEGLPVVARGDSWTYRTGRFVRRRKLGVAAAAAIVITLIGGVIATTWQARVASAERARAERRFNDVRKLANSVLFDYHDAIEALPGATVVRERLVKDALAYLDSLAAEASGDPALQRELAAAYDRVGSVLGKPYAASLGNVKGALESHQKALRIREALVASDPRNPQNQRELAESHSQIGWQLLDTMAIDAIREHFRRAISIYVELITAHPDDAAIRIALARAHNQLGGVLEDRGDLSGALENERRALALLKELYAASPGDMEIRRTLSTTYDYIARSLFLSGEVAAALENNGRALALRAALASEDPTDGTLRRMLAISYQNDGDFRDQSGDSAGALASFRRKLAIDEELLAADPANVQAHGDLGYSLLRIADILAARGIHAEALLHYRRSAEAYQRRDATAATLQIAIGLAGVARAQASLGNRSAALDAVRRAETITGDTPDDPANSAQRGTRAKVYAYMAETYVALATRQGSGPADAPADWSAACKKFQRSYDIWADMRRRGILNVADAPTAHRIAQAVGRCQTMPAESRTSGNGRS
jgi:non-specific serine/threonine protein kinase/serine/threonine-protein kinase